MTAVNHLPVMSGNHAEALQELTDEQLAEQVTYYEEGLAGATMPRSHYGWSKLLATATAEQRRRVNHE